MLIFIYISTFNDFIRNMTKFYVKATLSSQLAIT